MRIPSKPASYCARGMACGSDTESMTSTPEVDAVALPPEAMRLFSAAISLICSTPWLRYLAVHSSLARSEARFAIAASSVLGADVNESSPGPGAAGKILVTGSVIVLPRSV